MTIGLTWERLGLILFVGVLVSAGVYVVTQWLKGYFRGEAARHFAKLFPVALGVLSALAFFPLTLHLTGVTTAVEYSAPYVIATVIAGLVGGMSARLSYDMLAFLRDFLPELIRRKT